LLLIAEASARDEYWYDSGYDLAYDWTGELGRWAWENVFADRLLIADRLDRALAADPRPASVFRFLNNNDTGHRFISRYGPGVTRAAAALLLTLPGTPCIYTGDEVGAEYEPYGSPGVVDWDSDPHSLREWYRALCRLRAARPALRAPGWTRAAVVPDRGDLYAYLRHGEDGTEPLLVLLNFGGEEVTMQATLPEGFEALAGSTGFADLLHNTGVPGVDEGVPVSAGSARVLASTTGGGR
jgi:glycosidase